MEFNKINHRYMAFVKGYGYSPKTGEARFICNDGKVIVAKSPEEAERKIKQWIENR